MDVLTQAANVIDRIEQVERRSAGRGQAVLTLDLAQPAQRAAYAAAVAVLYAHGVDPLNVLDVQAPDDLPPAAPSAAVPPAGSDTGPEEGSPVEAQSFEPDAQDVDLRRAFQDALTELTPDEARRSTVVAEMYPRVRDLLRDGANVEAVAQIQYGRWVEERRHRPSEN